MRLLIDQMWPAVLAEQLRRRRHDAVAVLERDDLLHAADDVIFAVARDEERAVFTENVADYLPLATASHDQSEEYFGLVLTSDRAYPRGHPATLGRVVRALDELMTRHPERDALRDHIEWLAELTETR